MRHVNRKAILRFLRDEDGPATVEYAVIVMGVMLAVVTAIQYVAQMTGEKCQDSANKLNDALSGTGPQGRS